MYSVAEAQGGITTSKSDKLHAPEPYLTLPYDPEVNGSLLAGYFYDLWEIDQHGIFRHDALDIQLARLTLVRAMASGWALATWDEYYLRDERGELRRDAEGHPMTFGQGGMVQIRHENGRFTQYAHLGKISARIPYHAPVETEDGDLRPNPVLRAPVHTYRNRRVAVWVERGEVIGTVGLTGCAVGGVRTYDLWKGERNDQQLAEAGATHVPAYMIPHLHIVEFRRNLRNRVAERLDPCGWYGKAEDYPPISEWAKLSEGQQHHPLWLPQLWYRQS